MSFPPPWIWVIQKGFAANVWAAWAATLCLNSSQPLVETVPTLEHEGETLEAVQRSGHKGQSLCPGFPCIPCSPHQPHSLKGRDQPRQMRPCLMHEDMAQERRFPRPSPIPRSFLAPGKMGKKALAKETQRGN